MNSKFPFDQKLTVLQESDTFRKWYSLEDRRVCVLCGEVISGRTIKIWQGQRGGYQLQCATLGCLSSPRDWFYHGSRCLPPARVFRSRAPVLGFGLSLT